MKFGAELSLSEPRKEVVRIEHFIEEKLQEAGAECAVVGLSGGIDSSVCTLLARRASGNKKFVSVFMPEETTPERDRGDVKNLEKKFGFEVNRLNIDDIVNQFKEMFSDVDELSLANVKARVRMTVLYAVANERNGLVVGTGNLSEWLLGYFTKHGDGAADIEPIIHLYKTELRVLARELKIPPSIVEKPPSAGLWEGQTDEEELGASYGEIDEILYCMHELDYSRTKTKKELELNKEMVDHVYELVDRTRHKRIHPPGLDRVKSGTDQ